MTTVFYAPENTLDGIVERPSVKQSALVEAARAFARSEVNKGSLSFQSVAHKQFVEDDLACEFVTMANERYNIILD